MLRFGLALGGGGLRGLAHIGVLQVLVENGLYPDYIAGTSAGSIVAALYASGVSPLKMEDIVTSLDPHDYIDYNIIGLIKYIMGLLLPKYDYNLDGLIVGDKIENLVFEWTRGKSIGEAVLPLAIVACDIDSGRKIIFTNQTLVKPSSEMVISHALLSEAVRSSISIPVTFVPKKFRGMQMVDGGLKDIVPVMVTRSMGAEYVLGINLGIENYETDVSGIPQIIGRTLDILIYETSATEEDFFADMLLHPEVPEVGLTDLKDATKIIRAGRRVMRENLPQLKQQLGADQVTQISPSTYTRRKET
ncbi:MAG: patatin-like phospholipase family protein [Syntrophomonadaceae bacterium]